MVKSAKKLTMPYFSMVDLSLLFFLFLLFTLLVFDLSIIFKFLFFFKKNLLLVCSLLTLEPPNGSGLPKWVRIRFGPGPGSGPGLILPKIIMPKLDPKPKKNFEPN